MKHWLAIKTLSCSFDFFGDQRRGDMLVKDQIRMQMDRLGVSHRELAKRIGTSEQTARFWTAGSRTLPQWRFDS